MAPPIISRVSPSIGWPGRIAVDGTPVQGTLVIIHGRYFHPTPEMNRNQVSFASTSGGRVPAPVEWASVDEIDYQPSGVVVKDATTPGGLNAPRGVAVDAAGNLYIADTQHDRIVCMTPGGSFSSWGTHGSGNTQFNRPSGIAVDTNNFVYVADTMNHRIQKFDTNGTFITAWGSQGSGLGQFDMPVDVDVTILGGMTFVYVADSNNHRVVRTDGNGGMPSNFGTPAGTGSVLGVCAPRGYGFVYATDPSHKRIFRWAWFGSFNGTFGPPGDPHNLAVIDLDFPMGIEQDFDGYVYVVDQGAQVVRKFDPFDPSFREIARFGLTIPKTPGPTPDNELVDPVDVAVTDLKAAYIVDQQRKQVVRYTPTDSQEIWVHVPEGAASGQLEVRTDGGTASTGFLVWVKAEVEIADSYLCQGLVEYPLVAGKKTVIRYQMRTVNASAIDNYFWGSPVTDHAQCRILKDGVEVGQVDGSPKFKKLSGGAMSFEIGFEICFEIPYWLANDEGSYRFEVTLDRSGTPSFHDVRSFAGDFRNRKSYRIVSSPITHLRKDGTRVNPGPMFPALFYIGTDVGHFLDWMDWAQLYSGYLNYNRLYPIRYSMADITDYGIWVNDTMSDGINSEDETRSMLQCLEFARRRLNETGDMHFDFMLGIVSRNEVHQDWKGVTVEDYHSALISIGIDPITGAPAYDVGTNIGHELLHQHGVDHQYTREDLPAKKEPWNSCTGNFDFVSEPAAIMFMSPTDTYTLIRNDHNVFVEAGGDSLPDNYGRLFDALANPHPKDIRLRQITLGVQDRPRPPGTLRNFTLIGSLKSGGEFTRLASWTGKGTTPVTPQAKGSQDRLMFLDETGNELLRWPIRVSFGLRGISQDRTPFHQAEDTALISVSVPFPEATARVELVVDRKTVWSVDVPGQAPMVQLITPRGGERIGPTDSLTVEWRASHPQGVTLEYIVEYSFDGGETFRPLATALKETRYEWLAGLASSTGHVRVRVIASDGFNEASDVSDDIQVDDVLRRVVIVHPRRGEVVPEGKPISLLAVASDLERGPVQLNAANTRWILDGQVALGKGNEIEFRGIQLTTPRGTFTTPPPVGSHRLRVEVTVAPAKILSDEIPIQIAADSDRDGVPDDVEIERGTSPTDPGDSATIAPIYPFGQWRFHRWHTYTLYQVSHLGTGAVILDLSFRDEAGSPLARHPLLVIEDGSVRSISTDGEGHARVRLGSLQTVLLKLAARKERHKGFGTCSVRVAQGSPVRETFIQAHGWIYHRRACWLFGWESQGTVVINKGEPLRVRGAQTWTGYSPTMALPVTSYRMLGRLQMASQMVSRMLREAGDRLK